MTIRDKKKNLLQIDLEKHAYQLCRDQFKSDRNSYRKIPEKK